MFILFFVAIVVICILVIFMFFILRGTVKKINSQTKLYYVDKMQEYDYLIQDKLNQLDSINKEIKEKELGEAALKDDVQVSKNEFDYNIIELLSKTAYQDKNAFLLSKEIDEKFNIDYVALLKNFVKNIHDDGTYRFYLDFRNKFTGEKIYFLKEMDVDSIDSYMKEFLSDKEYQIYLVYKDLNKEVDIDGFIDYLNELVDLNNPKITVYVGKKDENYDDLSKYITTIYSKDIYKGIKIIYRNKIYDYSLNERNV